MAICPLRALREELAPLPSHARATWTLRGLEKIGPEPALACGWEQRGVELQLDWWCGQSLGKWNEHSPVYSQLCVELRLTVSDGQGSLACCSPWGHKESDTTEQLNWAELCFHVTGKADIQILFFWVRPGSHHHRDLGLPPVHLLEDIFKEHDVSKFPTLSSSLKHLLHVSHPMILHIVLMFEAHFLKMEVLVTCLMGLRDLKHPAIVLGAERSCVGACSPEPSP